MIMGILKRWLRNIVNPPGTVVLTLDEIDNIDIALDEYMTGSGYGSWVEPTQSASKKINALRGELLFTDLQ